MTAAAIRSAEAFRLAERVDGEAASPLEPALVARARERLEQRKPVARGAVTDAVALLVAVGARPPDQLGSGEKQIFIEVLPGPGEDTGSAGTPLETDPTISRPHELRPRCAGPIGQAVLAEHVPCQHGRRLGGNRIICVEPEQDERVACSAGGRAEAAVVV